MTVNPCRETGYSKRSLARRAVVDAGGNPDDFAFYQKGGLHYFRAVEAAADDEVPPKQLDADTLDETEEADGSDDLTPEDAEDAAVLAACSSDPRQETLPDDAAPDTFAGVATVKIVDFDGGDYGIASVTDAVDMAQMIADSDGTRVELLHPDTDAVLYAVQPEPDPVPALPEVERPVLVVAPEIAQAMGMESMIDAGLVRVAESDDPGTVQASNVVPSGIEHAFGRESLARSAGAPQQEDAKTGTPQQEHRESALPTLDHSRRYILCIEGGFPASSPEFWAAEISKKTKMPVVIRDAETKEIVATVDFAALKQAKKSAKKDASASRQHQPSATGGSHRPHTGKELAGLAKEMFDLACRPQGVLRSKLREMNGGVAINFKNYLMVMGRTRGYTISVDKSGSSPLYRLIHTPESKAA